MLYMRTQRLFTILDQLRVRRYPVSASELALQLGVSERTLYRDMNTLKEMGAPIRGEAGVGYQLEPGYFLPPLAFDADERDALILGLGMLTRDAKADQSLVEGAKRLISKIETAIFDPTLRDRPLKAIGRSPAPKRTHDIRNAIQTRRALKISYTDAEGNVTQRTVRPLGLTVFDTGWLLTAWCETQEDFRDFRLDRIKNLATLDEPFPLKHGQRFSDYLAQL